MPSEGRRIVRAVRLCALAVFIGVLLAGTFRVRFPAKAFFDLFRTDQRAVRSNEFPGPARVWHGFRSHEFPCDIGTIQVVSPRHDAPGRPWIWQSERLESELDLNKQLLERGFHVVRLRLPNLFGAPPAMAAWDACYDRLTRTHGLGPRSALVGVSRGALFCYNWAGRNPDKVCCIVGDCAVYDLRSWPVCRGRAKASPDDLAALMDVYSAVSEQDLLERALNPLDSLPALASHDVPLLHLYGTDDANVPWEENAAVVTDRYRALGRQCTTIEKPGVGHVSGLPDPTPIVEFIQRACGGGRDGAAIRR